MKKLRKWSRARQKMTSNDQLGCICSLMILEVRCFCRSCGLWLLPKMYIDTLCRHFLVQCILHDVRRRVDLKLSQLATVSRT
jgi:hypothetical protein